MTRTLVDVVASHLEPWWHCTHTLPPMGITLTIHECHQCEAEREEVASFLSGPIRGHLVGLIDALAGPNHEGVARFREDVREGYLLAIDEARTAIIGSAS